MIFALLFISFSNGSNDYDPVAEQNLQSLQKKIDLLQSELKNKTIENIQLKNRVNSEECKIKSIVELKQRKKQDFENIITDHIVCKNQYETQMETYNNIICNLKEDLLNKNQIIENYTKIKNKLIEEEDKLYNSLIEMNTNFESERSWKKIDSTFQNIMAKKVVFIDQQKKLNQELQFKITYENIFKNQFQSEYNTKLQAMNEKKIQKHEKKLAKQKTNKLKNKQIEEKFHRLQIKKKSDEDAFNKRMKEPKISAQERLMNVENMRIILKENLKQKAMDRILELKFNSREQMFVGSSLDDGTLYDERMGTELTILYETNIISDLDYIKGLGLMGKGVHNFKQNPKRKQYLQQNLQNLATRFGPFVKEFLDYLEKGYEARLLDPRDRSFGFIKVDGGEKYKGQLFQKFIDLCNSKKSLMMDYSLEQKIKMLELVHCVHFGSEIDKQIKFSECEKLNNCFELVTHCREFTHDYYYLDSVKN